MSDEITLHHIRSVAVKKLFGRYSYTLPEAGEKLSELNIFYANNGAGKTTLLSLVFHMLSPSDSRSHRTKIAEIPFYHLEIILNDGTAISAKKDPQLLIGPVTFEISVPSGDKVQYNFSPNENRSTLRIEDLPPEIDIKRIPAGIREEVKQIILSRNFHNALSRISVVSYMLTSDRILMSDSIASSRRDPHLDSKLRLSEMVSAKRIESVTEAMDSASKWVRDKYYDKSYSGESAKTLYEDVVRRIAKTTYRTKTGLNPGQETRAIASLSAMILDIDKRSKELSKYGLGTNAVSTEIVEMIATTKGNRLNLINSILDPYLNSIKSRIDSIYPLYTLIDTFVSQINKFLKDKKLTYSLRRGFQIYVSPVEGERQEITSSQLSSGEQQLVLLFSYVLISRDKPSIFIIDEPEISLNILWQRMLISSLQELVKKAEIQFIFASHSMEILSKHRNRVISMQEA